MIAEEKIEKNKHDMRIAAFTAWQSGQSKKNYPEYLRSLGLSEKKYSLSDKQKEMLSKRGVDIAEKIKQMDRKRKS